MTVKQQVQQKIINQILNNLTKISDKNLVKLVYFVELLSPKVYKPIVRRVRNLFQEKHPSLELTRRFLRDTNPNCREKLMVNLIINGMVLNKGKREKAAKEGNTVPYNILISPTVRCNLRCKGCYALNYKKEDDLSFEILDRIIQEAKEMGTAFFTILGGEPFLREDLFDLYQKHNDAYFQVYTNGTLINKKIAQRIREVGNIIPQISIEGFEKETDERRGKGIFEKVLKAMDVLKEESAPFGYSVCVTSKNIEVVTSDEFIDLMIEKGALMGWYFLYMPVSGDKDTALMPTPKQRKYLKDRRDYIRTTKPLFIIDFWNDAPYVGGCIAAKAYCHINNFGDLEPCIFTHFAQVNIKNSSLKEAMNCPLFKEIRARQPHSHNLLLPCMLIDHPKVIRELCQIYHPYPTHPGAQTLIEDLKDDLDKYSQEVHQIYDKIWKEDNKPKDTDTVE